MITAWTKHLKTATEIDEFEKYVKGSRRLLNRLNEILQENINQLVVTELSLKDYDNPSWAYKQAFRNGQKSALNSIQRLINLDHGEQT